MIFAVSIANLFLFLKGLYVTPSGLHWDFYCKSKLVFLRFKNSISQIGKRNEIVQRFPKEGLIYAVIAVTIILGPVIIDKSRNYKPPQVTLMDSLSVQSEGLFLISIQDSPHALFETKNEFVVNNPLIIPRTKLMNNKIIGNWPDSPFYLFNALNHFEFNLRRQYSPYLVIPETMLAPINLDDVSMIVLKGEVVTVPEYNDKIFFSKEIIKIILKNQVKF
jgi:hypothetical protein